MHGVRSEAVFTMAIGGRLRTTGCCAGPCLAASQIRNNDPYVPHAHRRARRREARRPDRRRHLCRRLRLVADFDEAFFGAAALDRAAVTGRRAGRPPAPVTVRRGADRRADRPAAPDPVHRAELQRPRRRVRPGRTGRADPVHQVAQHPRRPGRRRTDPAGLDQTGLGGGARHRHRPADQLPGQRRGGRGRIAGYVLVNDVSERAFQMERGGQWGKGKSAETFNPAGPWLVTPDEIADVLDLGMWLDVNGVRRQTGNTNDDLRPVLRRPLPEPVPGAGAR